MLFSYFETAVAKEIEQSANNAQFNNYPVLASFGTQKEFFFGIATAPAHIEDELQDSWLKFAYSGKVAAFHQAYLPHERLRFWSEPEVELDLAASTGIKVFRMGVDWGRLVPHEPGSWNCGPTARCAAGVQNHKALERYKDIVEMARARGMRVMLTLFHHSLPNWSVEKGGWTHSDTTNEFISFASDVVQKLSPVVDSWVTFNEPAVFALLTHAAGMWPPGGKTSFVSIVDIGPLQGKFVKALNHIADAHRTLYSLIHKIDTIIADFDVSNPIPAEVGIAHNVSRNTPSTFIDIPAAAIFDAISRYDFPDRVRHYLDFLGINYYGEEIVRGTTAEIRTDVEYSDSGRAINPNGLFEVLLGFHKRYNEQPRFLFQKSRASKNKMLPFLVTENGVSDSSDLLRASYIIEHLLAIDAARNAGVPIFGYVFWTISDNWEWADGYCPKFGLFEVDRQNGFSRKERNSARYFREIVKSGLITQDLRNSAWNIVRSSAGTLRPLCRAENGRTSLDEPRYRPLINKDWRFILPKNFKGY